MSVVESVNGKTGVVMLKASDVEAVATSQVGSANGVASLNSESKLPDSQLPSSEFNVKSFGAVGNGTADDYLPVLEAWEAAIAAAAGSTGGFVVRFPPGTYALNRSVEGGAPNLGLPANLKGRIIVRGAGRGVTTIRLSSNVVAFINGGKPGSTPEAGQTIRNCTVEDLTIDANSVASLNTGVVFEVDSNAINVDSLHARRVEVINAGAASSQRRNISINVTRNDPFGVPISTTLAEALTKTGVRVIPFTSEPLGLQPGMQFTLGAGESEETLIVESDVGKSVTVRAPGTTKTHTGGEAIKLLAPAANTISNIVVEDCDFGWGAAGEATGGGGTGVYVGAFCTPSQSGTDNAYYNATLPAANVLIDQIVCRRVRWRTSSDPTGFNVNAGIQIGGDGYCGKVDLTDCSMRGSGDAGYEIDSCLDLTISKCKAENCWNENFFIANSHGGLPWPQRQMVRFVDCTSVISADNVVAAPFAAYSFHGTSFGELIFQNCVYKHTSARFLNGPRTAEANPSNGAFRITGQWRRAFFARCAAIYDGLALEATSGSFTTTPLGIVIQQMGGTSSVDVHDFSMEINGTAKEGSFTSCSVQADCVDIDYATNLYLTIDGIQPRTNFKMLDSIAFRMREVNLNTSVGTMTETWSVANTLNTQYIVDAGSLADLKQESGFLACSANPTVRQLLRIWNGLFVNNSPNNQTGKCMDGSVYVQAEVAKAAVAGTELIARLRVSDAGNIELRARVVDEGGETKLSIEKVKEGVVTTLGEPGKLVRITTGERIGVRLKQQGNSLTADYFSGARLAELGKAPAYNEAGSIAKVAGTFTGETTEKSTKLTNVSSFAGLATGQAITGPGIPASTTITALNEAGKELTLSHEATATHKGETYAAGQVGLTHALGSGAEQDTWGALGLPGYIGWGWTPGETSAKLNLIKYDHLSVIGGSIDRLTPVGNQEGANVTTGLVVGAASTLLRFRGKLRCRGWLREAVKKDSPTDIASPDEQQKKEIEVSQSTLAVPVSAGTISVGSSPFEYVNLDMVQEDVEVSGGTISKLELIREGTATTLATAALTALIRLMPGDALKVTYSAAPTMQKVPAY